LVPYVKGWAKTLEAQEYCEGSVAGHLRLLAHLSSWLAERELAPARLTPELVEQYAAGRKAAHLLYRSPRGLAPLLEHLRAVGAIPPAPEEVFGNQVLRAYGDYLAGERVVKPVRRRAYLAVAGELLASQRGSDLAAADVVRDVRAHVGCGDLRARLTALRSVLTFLFLRGYTPGNLAHAVPSAPCRRLASLPMALEDAELDAALAVPDRRTTLGRRDYASLLLMARLGLRAGEVAALTLDDIDWEAGEIRVHGKGGTTGRLPLPADVGSGIASYLRRRGHRHAQTRSLLLRSRAPYRGSGAGMFIAIAQRALRAIGISRGGAHRLRHTAATQMLRAGASLTEIAQVLRHRHIDTTAIYAKVDRDGLRTLAQPWPSAHVVSPDQLRPLAQPWPGGDA
jgi:site-specific recombinase XerD